MQSRVQTLEQALLSGEGGAIEEQITLTLVKKGKKLSIIPTLKVISGDWLQKYQVCT